MIKGSIILNASGKMRNHSVFTEFIGHRELRFVTTMKLVSGTPQPVVSHSFASFTRIGCVTQVDGVCAHFTPTA